MKRRKTEKGAKRTAPAAAASPSEAVISALPPLVSTPSAPPSTAPAAPQPEEDVAAVDLLDALVMCPSGEEKVVGSSKEEVKEPSGQQPAQPPVIPEVASPGTTTAAPAKAPQVAVGAAPAGQGAAAASDAAPTTSPVGAVSSNSLAAPGIGAAVQGRTPSAEPLPQAAALAPSQGGATAVSGQPPPPTAAAASAVPPPKEVTAVVSSSASAATSLLAAMSVSRPSTSTGSSSNAGDKSSTGRPALTPIAAATAPGHVVSTAESSKAAAAGGDPSSLRSAALPTKEVHALLERVSPGARIDTGAARLVSLMADRMLDDVVASAASVARHRGSRRLEASDLRFVLERSWGLSPPQPQTSKP